MPLQPPFIALRVSDDIPAELAALDDALRSGTRESQAERAGRLITRTSCDLLDDLFGAMVRKLMLRHPGDPMLLEAQANVDHVQGILRQYLGWLTGFVSNQRMLPVASHYRGLFTRLTVAGETGAYLAFPVPPALAAAAKAHMDSLADGSAQDARAGIETLIDILDEALHPLMHEPKRLMKFNFVVDKTLNGVIAVTTAFGHRALRKLGGHVPPALLPELAAHLRVFLHHEMPA